MFIKLSFVNIDVCPQLKKRGKRISNIFSFQGHTTLKPRSKFIFKNNSKLNGRKLGFNIPLTQ